VVPPCTPPSFIIGSGRQPPAAMNLLPWLSSPCRAKKEFSLDKMIMEFVPLFLVSISFGPPFGVPVVITGGPPERMRCKIPSFPPPFFAFCFMPVTGLPCSREIFPALSYAIKISDPRLRSQSFHLSPLFFPRGLGKRCVFLVYSGVVLLVGIVPLGTRFCGFCS